MLDEFIADLGNMDKAVILHDVDKREVQLRFLRFPSASNPPSIFKGQYSFGTRLPEQPLGVISAGLLEFTDVSVSVIIRYEV